MEKVQKNMNIYNQLYIIHQDGKDSQLRVTFQSNMRVWEWQVGSEITNFPCIFIYKSTKANNFTSMQIINFYHSQPLKQSLNVVFPSLALFYF